MTCGCGGELTKSKVNGGLQKLEVGRLGGERMDTRVFFEIGTRENDLLESVQRTSKVWWCG